MGHSNMQRYNPNPTYYRTPNPNPNLTPFPTSPTPNPYPKTKGDGDAFKDYLEEHYPHLSSARVNRAENSKRQDWSVEALYDIFPLLEPLMSYTVGTLLDEANLLRDSLLVTLECVHRTFQSICPR
jgi:hypothetical protein